jgi:CheY-like chemotaxis protein
MKDKIILVVEDDIVSCELFKELFENEGIKSFIIVYSGEDAIEVCKTVENIHLVLMDYKLPGMDGCETLKEIRKINKDIYIVMQTAYAYDLKKELIKDCEIDDYITKPIISDELFRIINKYCKNNPNYPVP